ncbi:MAG: enhanced serine sensitivity protein SseB C-terminal domain-containing protein, partial [Tepidisphaerales bacterium]
DLERSLIKATTDPAHRPQFYRDFIGAEVYVIQHGPIPSVVENRDIRTGENLQLRTWERDGHTIIPIFSSLPRLQAFIKEEVGYLAMKTPAFLELTRGAALILNPDSDYGKEFTAEEVASILDGSLWKPSERWVAQKETKVLVGQPANYPLDLVLALSRYFQTTPQVERAYLVHFFNAERDEKPHTLIAIEVTGDWDQCVAGAGLVASSVAIPDPPVDFMQLTGKGGIEDQIRRSDRPFYKR